MMSVPQAPPSRQRVLAILIGVGFASGLPNTVVNTTISAWLSAIGVDVKSIGLFTLISFPYILKFAWAPLMDHLAIPGLGRRRGWLVVMQSLLTFTLLAMAIWGPVDAEASLVPLGILGVVMVFFSASLDIVADAYRTDILETDDYARGAARFVAGYRLAAVLAGALVLILATHIGWHLAFGVMVVMMAATVVVSLLAPEPRGDPTRTMSDPVIEPLKQLSLDWGNRLAFLLAFIALFRLPDLLANPMTNSLLIQHLKFSSEDVGWIRQALGFALTICGALAGAGVVARLGLMRSLVLFGVFQSLSNAGFIVLATNRPGLWSMAAVIAVENFCGGLVSAGFVSFLMSCCHRQHSATQYALLSGVMATAGLLAGATTGFLVQKLGYAGFFGLSIVAGVPGMMLIPLLRPVGAR